MVGRPKGEAKSAKSLKLPDAVWERIDALAQAEGIAAHAWLVSRVTAATGLGEGTALAPLSPAPEPEALGHEKPLTLRLSSPHRAKLQIIRKAIGARNDADAVSQLIDKTAERLGEIGEAAESQPAPASTFSGSRFKARHANAPAGRFELSTPAGARMREPGEIEAERRDRQAMFSPPPPKPRTGN